MTNEFSKRDRNLIIKIAKQSESNAKRIKQLEKDASKMKEKQPSTAFNSFADDSITLQFRDDIEVDDFQRTVIINSLHSVLTDICDSNGITRLDACITTN
jgi:hypothetical protein